jgi:AraC-like DNA-binding protein
MSATSDYRELPPPPALAAHVACFWTRTTGDDGADLTTRVVPDGCIDIVWIGDTAPSVAGPATQSVVCDLPPRSHTVGVRFRPGMAASVLGVPAHELLDAETPLRDIWGAAAGLAARVSEFAAVEERLEAAEATVVERLATATAPDVLVAAMAAGLARRPSARVGDLSRDAGLSERQLRRRFEAAVGYGPKTLHRVLRFQRWLALARQPEAGRLGLAGLAMLAGYADQAHMTREVSRLAGVPPTSLLQT